jgi:Family of unknown function (DUF6152)
MIRSFRFTVLSCLAVAGAGAAFAHHNAMEGFDEKAPVVLKGEISKVDWSGEHAMIFIKASDGKSWKVQGAPVTTMKENGLDEASFGGNGVVTIRGYQSKDKACKPDCLATGKDVSFADGLKVSLDGSHAKEQGKAVHDQLVKAKGVPAGHH